MKNKILIYCLTLCLAYGCNQDLDLFDDHNYVSIDLEKNAEGFSEYSYTFQYLPVDTEEAEISIPVSLAGRKSVENRNFSVRIVDSLTTAVAGTHYRLDTTRNIIPEDSFKGDIYVKLLKTEDMSEISYTLGLEIVSNDHLKYGDNRMVVITFSNRLERPEWWYTNAQANIGYYTQRKLALWFEFWEITDGSDPWKDYKEWKYGMWIFDRYKTAADKEMFKAWLNKKPTEYVTDEYGDLVILTLYRLER